MSTSLRYLQTDANDLFVIEDGILKKNGADCLSSEYKIGSKLNAYGGKSYLAADGKIFFVNKPDQSIYCFDGSYHKLYTAHKAVGDLSYDPHHDKLFAITEDGNHSLIAIDCKSKEVKELLTRSGFISSPRPSPDGKQIAYLTWDAPYMPWDSTFLYVANLEQDTLVKITLIDGGEEISIVQPSWIQNDLFYLSDQKGYYDLYRQGTLLLESEAEFADPLWVFGKNSYVYTENGGPSIVLIEQHTTCDRLVHFHLETSEVTYIELPFSALSSIASCKNQIYLIAESPTSSPRILSWEMNTHKPHAVYTPPCDEQAAEPAFHRFETADQSTLDLLYYAPKDVSSPPPLILKIHGGPTLHVKGRFASGITPWLDRGYAYAEFNYRGSSGYGRAFRNRLRGNWGVIDAEDTLEAAKYLIDHDLCDPDRLILWGSSAGALTLMQTLRQTQLFKVAVVPYGVMDLETLLDASPKFERNYFDLLIGPYPEAKSLYQERSPMSYLDEIDVPTLFFHGHEDLVIPMEQSIQACENFKKRNVPTELLLFEGEGHGFYLPQTHAAIEKSIDAFLKKLL